MDDYKDVAERIDELAAKYPSSSLQSELEPIYKDGELVGWLCKAFAYRTPDDERPGIGHAFEPVPGKTPYTRDSEAMNAETSAWGRAIVALGFQTKKIASKQEVAARQKESAKGTDQAGAGEEATNGAPAPAAKFATEAQRKRLFALAKEHGIEAAELREILNRITGQESTAQIPRDKYDAVCVAVQTHQLVASLAGGSDDVPFE